MANEREIKIVLRADGTAAIAGIRSVGSEVEGLGSKASSFAQSFQKNWAAVGAGVTAAYLALQKIWGAMDAAAQYQEKMETLNALTSQYGMTAQNLTRAIKDNSQGLVDVATAANVAADALGKGLDPQKVAQIAKWAPTLADFSGGVQSTSQAFETLTQSIANARDRGIVQLMGATIDLEARLGSQYQTMSKVERSTAAYNLVAEQMAKIQAITGTEANSAADRMERFNNSLTQGKIFLGQLLLVIGQPFMAVFNAALAVVAGVAAGIGSVVANVAWLTDTLKITEGTEKKVMAWTNEAFAFAADQAGQAKDNLIGGVEQLLSLGQIGATAAARVGVDLGAGGSPNMKALEKAAEERKKAIEQEAKDWGALAQARIDEDEEVARVLSRSLAEQVRHEDEALKYRQEKSAEYYQWEIDEMNRVIVEGYDKWLEAEMRLLEIRREQRDLLYASNMANTQNALGAIGGSDMSSGVEMLGALGAGVDPYTQDFERWKLLQDEKLTYMVQIGASEQEWKTAFAEEELQREQMKYQQQIAMAASSFSVVANLGAAMYAASGNKSREAFKLMQAMRIGETIMNTYSAAVGSYQALAPIPIIGPALGAAAAAAAIAYGMAQVRAISSMKPGTTSASTSSISSSVGSTMGGATASGSSDTPAEEKSGSAPIVNIHVYGNVVSQDEFAREMVPAITKALEDGVK